MSVQAAPETIHNELLKELALIYRGGQPNDIVLRALRNKADLLAKVDPGGALEVRGHVHLLKGELRAGQDLFDRALNMSASRSRLFIRYLQGLEHSGHLQAVADVFVKHRDVLEGVADATRQAMVMLAAHGYLQLSGELRADLERMNVPIGEVTYPPGEQSLVLSERDAMTDAETSPVVRFVREYLYARKVTTAKVAITTITGEGNSPSSLLYELSVDVDPKRAAELEWDLYGALEEQNFRVEAERKLLFALTSNATES